VAFFHGSRISRQKILCNLSMWISEEGEHFVWGYGSGNSELNMFQLTLAKPAVPGLSLLYLVGSLVSLRSWDPSSPSTTASSSYGMAKKKKKKKLSGTFKIPVDCRSCDLAGALTYCSFLSPYLGFVGIKFNQEKQKTKPVLVCLLIFGFVFTFARAKQRK